MKKKPSKFRLRDHPSIIKILLKDRTTNKNIVWGTNNYSNLGNDMSPSSEIDFRWIVNGGKTFLQPRVEKDLEIQRGRTKDKAEVFTPTWVVQKQIDLIEEVLKDMNLEEYVSIKWLEITCGEAPYICTRYDVVTGRKLEFIERVGFLDRKLGRISAEINENNKWTELVMKAYQSSYGYEYQGDSLFIARENLVYTYVDYYFEKFNRIPPIGDIEKIAEIVSYNVFQMDGLTYTVPYTEKLMINNKNLQLSLFDEVRPRAVQVSLELKKPDSGRKVKIKNWHTEKMFNIVQSKLEGESNMKFDVVIGNPPYQENDLGRRDDGSTSASASPLYHLFVTEAKKIAEMQSLIIPSRWTSGAGKGLISFSDDMLKSNSFLSFTLFTDSKKIFPNNDIKGGVCYFLSSNNYHGKANVEVYHNSIKNKSYRYLDENNLGVFIPYNELNNIVSKVLILDDNSEVIQDIVSVRKPFGIPTDFFKSPKKYKLPKIYNERFKTTDIKIYGLEKGKRTEKYIPKTYPIEVGEEMIYKYKVVFSYAYGTGAFGEKTAPIIIGKPGEICTETFLTIGAFDSEVEAVNLSKYIKTKFFRALVGILKTTQHATRTFRLVPLQSFKKNSDIDWEKSIPSIDRQLYEKYKLTEDEVSFIENNVEVMS